MTLRQVVDGVISSQEVEELRQILDDDRHGIDLTTKHPAFLALARDPRLVKRITSLLGPDITLQHSKSVQKPVGDGPQPGGKIKFHQVLSAAHRRQHMLPSLLQQLLQTS